MKTTKILTLLTALMMLLSFAACGTAKGNTTNTTAEIRKAKRLCMTAVNPNTKDEEPTCTKTDGTGKRDSFRKQRALGKGFHAADKGMAMIEDGGNYGDFLLKTIDGAKDQFSADEYEAAEGVGHRDQEIEEQADRAGTKVPRDHAKSI